MKFDDNVEINAVSIQSMFTRCYKLESVNLSGFKVSNVDTLVEMFNDCHALKEIDSQRI